MKKLILLCATTLFVIQVKAQIPNPGFEIRHTDGSAANWQPSSFIVFPVDSNCVHQGWDSIQMSTHDAHSGSYAYEIRVATTCQDAYSGSVQTNRYDSNGFFDQRLPISGQPASFTFFYKLASAQGDFGVADVMMEDGTGGSTGNGRIKLLAAATWTMATLPMSYSVSDTGGLLRLKFFIGNDTAIHYGTRFVIDDIGQSAPTSIAGITKTTGSLVCFPSPAQNSVSICLSGATAGVNVLLKITDITGRTVAQAALPVPQDRTFTVDTHTLAPGVYYVKLAENGRISTGHFLK